MATAQQPLDFDQNNNPRKPPVRWHRLYYLLAAFDLFTVCMSLFLGWQIMDIYRRSVAVNQTWVERLHESSELGELASAVNAPGNNVFESGNVDAESAKMSDALKAFEAHLQALRSGLSGVEQAQAAPLLASLDEINAANTEMVAETHQIFAHLRKGQQAEAGKRMATMDQKFARANTELVRLRKRIGAIQKEHFEQQTAEAASLQKLEYVIAGLILLMVGGATAYGHKIAGQVRSDVREKDRYIEALRHSEEELRRARDELEERVKQRTAELVQASKVRTRLLQQVMTAQEDERRRIARDLHDEVGQSLTSLLIGLRGVQEAATMEAASRRVEELRRITSLTLDEVQRLARGLRPSVLDDLGLEAALERYAADYSRAHGIEVRLQVPGSAHERLPGAVETALYRIVQEALTNSAKHSQAGVATIQVQRLPGLVRAVVEDDGCGFDPGHPPSVQNVQNASGRLGLPGMKERAALLNGSITVDSEPGRGTRITVVIPLKENGHGENSRAAGG